MVGRDNAHIPKNSWPSFSWYVIEFAIVFAVANLIAFQIIPTVDGMIGQQNLLLCEQVSWLSKCAPSEEKMSDTGTTKLGILEHRWCSISWMVYTDSRNSS